KGVFVRRRQQRRGLRLLFTAARRRGSRGVYLRDISHKKGWGCSFGLLLNSRAEQYDWLADMDEEVDEQELEAHYSYMAKIQEVPTVNPGNDSEPVEQNDQNDVESDDECVALANLIAIKTRC
nr:hypothetical protein [Tanacetum cinerariifolium]